MSSLFISIGLPLQERQTPTAISCTAAAFFEGRLCEGATIHGNCIPRQQLPPGSLGRFFDGGSGLWHQDVNAVPFDVDWDITAHVTWQNPTTGEVFVQSKTVQYKTLAAEPSVPEVPETPEPEPGPETPEPEVPEPNPSDPTRDCKLINVLGQMLMITLDQADDAVRAGDAIYFRDFVGFGWSEYWRTNLTFAQFLEKYPFPQEPEVPGPPAPEPEEPEEPEVPAKSLEERVADLERRVAALETK